MRESFNFTIQNLHGLSFAHDAGAFDLMAITKPIVCVWNILKYSLRIWNGKMKKHDLEKVAHYAELAWTLAGGEIEKVSRE